MSKSEGAESVWQWLVEQGEETVSQVAGDVLQNPRVSEALAGAFKRAAQTKGEIDRNVERMLGALNVVTRTDHEELLRKIDALQGSLVNINIKLDRLLAQKEAAKGAKPAPRRSPGRATSQKS